MFPIPFNKPYRRPDGTLTTIGDVIASGGGGGGGSDGVYVGETDPDNSIGEDDDFYLKVRKVYATTPLVTPQNSNANMIYSNEWSSDGVAWHLLDGNGSTYWSTQENHNTNEYCGYDFGENDAVVVNRVGINPRQWASVVQIHNFKIQASNDNTSWVDLYTGEIPNDVSYAGRMNYFDFENETAYRYYRLFVVDANTSKTITVFEMQLYQYTDEVSNVEVVDTYKKINGEWVASLTGYEIKTHSTGDSDASMDIFLMVFGVTTYYKTLLYSAGGYNDGNISLTYSNGWKLTPLVTMYDENGDEVTGQTWSYGTSKDFTWYLYDPTE